MKSIQKMYTKQSSRTYILSPYLTFNSLGNKICISRTDTFSSITICASDIKVLDFLVKILQSGIEEKELITILLKMGVDEPYAWINKCIQEGIIE